MRILLAGQPNCGKTTLFNRLTGRREHTGNRAGVTVSCARARLRGREEELVDLPGLYSLTGGGPDEQAARRALETEDPDLILNVVDSTALRRSLVLTLQLLALGRPTAVLLNMADEARKKGIRMDHGELSRRLGVPVWPISARTGEGLDFPLVGRVSSLPVPGDQQGLFRLARDMGRAVVGQGGVRRQGADKLLLHPLWGLPLFALILGLVFLITFQWVGPWLSGGMEMLTAWARDRLSGTALDLPPVTKGLLGSAGYVLSFLPIITVLSLLLTLLEDVGYLPRAAFLLDGWLKKLGLDGRCAVPLLLGFGCSVPAVMATRTLPENGLRRRTVQLMPATSRMSETASHAACAVRSTSPIASYFMRITKAEPYRRATVVLAPASATSLFETSLRNRLPTSSPYSSHRRRYSAAAMTIVAKRDPCTK